MESIGEKFKEARKEKGLFIEQVARETNISKSYIEAIEGERFEEFPGEAYLIGFLRSYSTYIGFNPEEIIDIYRKTKIQENPVPVELIMTNSKFPVLPVIIVAAILLVAAGGIYLFINRDNFFTREVVERNVPVSVARNSEIPSGNEYEMTSVFMERRFSEGDSVIIRYNDNPYRIIIKETSNGRVLLGSPREVVELAQGEGILLDIDGDGSNDIRVIVRDVDAVGRRAVLRFDRSIDVPFVASTGAATAPASAATTATTTPAVTTTPPAVATTPAAGSPAVARTQGEVVILESDTMQPFRINLNFNRNSFMRYEVDGGRREERLFRSGDVLTLDVSQEIKIWVSGAQALSATVNNVEYNFGTTGTVSARAIGWSARQPGEFVIRSTPLQ
ncbi:MAG: helix-turn-helix domain-containing protein [Spirochaetaceae bacterium]|nr:helix-turn-helix domain-containing protein [Spirochaetaceae bacterium]